MMTLDDTLLKDASAARDELLDLQHREEVTRANYHHTIRRLHAAGGSLREIAEALGLSHQRVHQIVEPGAPGPMGGPGGHRHGPPGAMHRAARRLRGMAGFERFTNDARAVVAGAVEAAAELGSRRVGTEHLVLSLAGAPADTVTGRAMAALSITREAAVAAVTARLGTHPQHPGGRRPFTPATRRVLERSLALAVGHGDAEIRADHVLLAVVADAGDGAAVLSELGADGAAVQAAVDAARTQPAGG